MLLSIVPYMLSFFPFQLFPCIRPLLRDEEMFLHSLRHTVRHNMTVNVSTLNNNKKTTQFNQFP